LSIVPARGAGDAPLNDQSGLATAITHGLHTLGMNQNFAPLNATVMSTVKNLLRLSVFSRD